MYWRLGDSAGDPARDEIGADPDGDNPGTYVGGTATGVAGPFGGPASSLSTRFDGIDGKVTFSGVTASTLNGLLANNFAPITLFK